MHHLTTNDFQIGSKLQTDTIAPKESIIIYDVCHVNGGDTLVVILTLFFCCKII